MKSAFTLPAVVLAASLAPLASGCASVDDAKGAASDKPRAQRVDAITGTRIPNKTPLPAQSDVEREKTVERMRELQKTSVPVQTRE